MKAIKNLCQILMLVCGVGALVLFFVNFATITSVEGVATATGAQLGFGSKVAIGDVTYDMAKSADLWFCFFLTAIAAVLAALSFKFRGASIASPVFALAGGIYMLVVALSAPAKFIDTRPLTGITAIEYSPFVLLCAIALLAAAVTGFLFILVRNYIEVKESNGKKKTIFQRIIQFFRDYKGEIKKIVWPDLKSVVKNTGIVLAVCAIVGIFIWLLDFGLAKLLNLVLGI